MDIDTDREVDNRHGWYFPSAENLYKRPSQASLCLPDEVLEGLDLCESVRTAIDVGAHFGRCTMEMLHRFNRVLAFEPARDSFAALRKNVDIIGPHRAGSYKPAELHNQAVGAGPGRVHMALAPRFKAMGDTGARYAMEAGPGTIDRVDIDSLNIEDLDFLLLDIEGGEAAAIQGAAQTLTRCSPVVVFADNTNWCRYGGIRDEPQRLLTGLGFAELENSGGFATWVKE